MYKSKVSRWCRRWCRIFMCKSTWDHSQQQKVSHKCRKFQAEAEYQDESGKSGRYPRSHSVRFRHQHLFKLVECMYSLTERENKLLDITYEFGQKPWVQLRSLQSHPVMSTSKVRLLSKYTVLSLILLEKTSL